MSPVAKRKPSAGLPRLPGTAPVAWGLAVVALVAIGWLEVGWFVTDRADVVCVGREDGSVTCTAIRYYRYRTESHAVDGVIGVTVVEIDSTTPEGGGPSYELRLLRQGGRDGASLDRGHSTRRRADREARRLAARFDVAPGEQITERTIEPLSTVSVAVQSVLLGLVTVVLSAVAVMGVVLMALFLQGPWERVRRRRKRLGRR